MVSKAPTQTQNIKDCKIFAIQHKTPHKVWDTTNGK